MHRFSKSVVCVLCVWTFAACGSDNSASSAGTGGTGGTPSLGASGGAGGTGATTGTGSSACQTGCTESIAANCSNGPADQASCVTTCESLLTGTCGTQYKALQDCGVGQAITCNAGIPSIASCATQQTAFVNCLNQ